jgi:hypothetical protein
MVAGADKVPASLKMTRQGERMTLALRKFTPKHRLRGRA